MSGFSELDFCGAAILENNDTRLNERNRLRIPTQAVLLFSGSAIDSSQASGHGISQVLCQRQKVDHR